MRRPSPIPSPPHGRAAAAAALSALLAAALVAGCSSAPIRLELPEALAGTPELAVAGRQGWSRLSGKPMTFGDFRAEEIRRGRRATERRTDDGWTLRLGETEYTVAEERLDSRQRIHFRALDEGATAWVECLRAESGSGLVFTRRSPERQSETRLGDRVVTFACTGTSEDGGPPLWSLVLRGDEPRTASGILDVGGEVFAIASTDQVSTGARVPVPVGFVFRRDDRPVAAVDTLGRPGAVRLAPELPAAERAALAAAAAALLLLD